MPHSKRKDGGQDKTDGKLSCLKVDQDKLLGNTNPETTHSAKSSLELAELEHIKLWAGGFPSELGACILLRALLFLLPANCLERQVVSEKCEKA